MNEKANEVLAQLMERALNGVDAAVEFSQQQVPAVIEQLLMWHMAEAAVYVVVSACVVVAYWIVVAKFAVPKKIDPVSEFSHRNYKANLVVDCDGDVHAGVVPVFIVGLVANLVGLIELVSNAMTFAKIWLAPKLYLLEYGASLIK